MRLSNGAESPPKYQGRGLLSTFKSAAESRADIAMALFFLRVALVGIGEIARLSVFLRHSSGKNSPTHYRLDRSCGGYVIR